MGRHGHGPRRIPRARRAGAGDDAKKVVSQAVTAVASVLGNTSAVCRASYIHPAVVDGFLDGSLAAHLAVPARRRRGTYTDDERALLDLLAIHARERLTRDRRRARAA